MPDAVVIGSGPNGLAAANVLADAGWDVVVLESAAEPGGAVRTAELVEPGFRNDLFSAFYPLGAASPVLRALELERHGLRWCHAPSVVAHPQPDGSCAVLSRDLDVTAASLDSFAPGDGDAWRRLYGLWERVGTQLIDALCTPFPPVRAGACMLRALGADELVRFLRFALLPVRRMAEEEFRGAGGGLLLAGNALHSDLLPESVASGMYGWLLCGLGQQVGYPVPEGGAGELTAALVRRLERAGGRVECSAAVTRIVVRDGAARGVRTTDGREIDAARAVLADVGAPALYEQLLPPELVPQRLRDDLRRFQYDSSTVKVDWTLSAPIPWTAEAARGAGTVHLTDGMDALSDHASQLVCGQVPDRPFLVFGQYAATDPTRQPPGAETAWGYTHVPQKIAGDAGGDGIEGRWDERETEAFVARMEAQVERFAPGFRELIRGRHVFTPVTMEETNQSLAGGAINSGTAQLHQQLLFRPTPALGRPETSVDRLYLASASAHPGGGVNGAAGGNAARVALGRESALRRPGALLARAAQRKLGGWH
jgi:phytoene dehydrogenase-like protein